MAETFEAQLDCPNCAKLMEAIARLEARVAELEAKLAKATKNSTTSSKPPSSDFVQPPKKRRQPGKRRQGGQPGHPRHERKDFSPEEIDLFQSYSYEACPDCGGSLKLADAAPYVIQQVEIDEKPTIVTEHAAPAQWCEHCQKMHHFPFPEELIKAGLVGSRLTALVAYLKGPCHASFSTIRKFFRDVVGFRISRGQLAKLVQKISASLADPYEQLLAMLPAEDVLNVDETGHKDSGERLWTWCFRAACYTLYKIDASRGSEVLLEVLGKEFDGVLGCDYFGAYRKYMRLNENVIVQFCLAHLIRDVKFLVSWFSVNWNSDRSELATR
jgi:transposase